MDKDTKNDKLALAYAVRDLLIKQAIPAGVGLNTEDFRILIGTPGKDKYLSVKITDQVMQYDAEFIANNIAAQYLKMN